tara:strand:- start:326 stop:652 length:327 start_codon:yes stop_codon:yes gene_type:complete
MLRQTPIDHSFTTYVSNRLEDGRTNVTLHKLAALEGDKEIARLIWADGTGEIEKLWVDEDHRRQGYATSLWNLAQWTKSPPIHSSWRTDDGQAWAESITHQLPERKYA